MDSQRLVVRNTFLEFDDVPYDMRSNQRARARSDITEAHSQHSWDEPVLDIVEEDQHVVRAEDRADFQRRASHEKSGSINLGRTRTNTVDFFTVMPDNLDTVCFPNGLPTSPWAPYPLPQVEQQWFYSVPCQEEASAGWSFPKPLSPPPAGRPTLPKAMRKNRVSQQGDRSGVPPQEGGHSKGPKAEARATKAEGAPPAPLDRPTTAILRNIPNAFSSSMLLDLLDTRGFRARYNYIYLPVGFLDGKNLGYSFVNFLSHEDALDFTEAFNGFSAWGTGEKSGSVSWSQVQGVQAHVERYRNSPVMHPSIPNEFKPMVFQDGQCVPFPPPTKAIKAPKVRVKVASQASISPALAA